MPFHTMKQLYLKSLTDPHATDCLINKCYSITSVLSHFFLVEQHGTFHQLQYETGMIIGGSVALQYLDGRHFDFSDIDLYVQHRSRFPIIRWIITLGYIYSPNSDTTVQNFNKAIGTIDHTIEPGDEDCKRADGAYKSAASILTFRHPLNSEIIQLITTHWNPLEMILNFHSSAY